MVYIFDIGNVLISFQPEARLATLFAERHLAVKMQEIIFQSDAWLQMDAGLLSHADALTLFCTQQPEYVAALQQTMQSLTTMLTPITPVVELLPEIKAAGHRLFYLSNYHRELRDYIVAVYPFFSLFEGGVFSCDVQINKPQAGIYRALLRRYQLDAADCLFFDDVAANVAAAEREGIHGVLFKDAASIKAYLYSE